MKNWVYGLLNPHDSSPRLRELTLAWSRYGYHGDIIEAKSVDHILNQAAKQQTQFCLIQRAGHVIDEQWYLAHWQREGFYQGMERLMQQANFLISGQWLTSDSGCVGLSDDCMLVNLDQYRALGCPPFGEANRVVHSMRSAVTMADQVDHLVDGGETLSAITDMPGWRFVQQSFEHDLPVIRFGDAVDDCRFDLLSSPDHLSELVGKPINQRNALSQLNAPQIDFVRRIQTQFERAQQGVFLFNIEPYDDLTSKPNAEPLDAVFSVAAGFKPYRILCSQGFTSQTELVLFDYSAKALEVRRYIVEQWDGDDFPKLVRDLFARYPQQDVFYQLWHGVTPDTVDWDDIEHLWQQELEKWGGAEVFRARWQQCRALPHKYYRCDLLQGRAELLQELARHNRSYIWWSNAFYTIFSHWHYRFAERKQHYIDWINELANTAPQCQINGADHNNMAVNGMTAIEYQQRFNQHRADELIPQRINSVDIQF